MAYRKDKNVILLPIFPDYAEAIINGKKTVEFRKLNIPESIKYVVIYSSSPFKKIIGFFSVKGMTKETPEKLWIDFNKKGEVKKDFLFDYYLGHSLGLAIHVGRVSRARKPVELSYVNKRLKAPQSFLYLNKQEWETIKVLCEK